MRTLGAALIPLVLAQAAIASAPFLLAWGTYGTAPGQFNRPHTLAVDAAGDVYVVDTNNERIQKFDNNGAFLSEWPVGGAGIAVDASGRIAIARPALHVVEVRDASAALLFTCAMLPTAAPYDVAFDTANRLFVTDLHNHRIEVFESDGSPRGGWGVLGSAPGELQYPAGIAVSFDRTVFVADQGNHRIQAFSSDGTFRTEWGSRGTAPGQFDTPNFIAVDADGDIYVADENNNRIQRFSATGELRSMWGASGSGPGRFRFPNDVAVDRDGHVFVADTDNHRIQKFGLDPTPARRATFGRLKGRYRSR